MTYTAKFPTFFRYSAADNMELMPVKNSITAHKYSSSPENSKVDDVIEKAAEQLAVLLWKTWLHDKKRREGNEKDVK